MKNQKAFKGTGKLSDFVTQLAEELNNLPEKSHFEDIEDWTKKRCNHPEHKPPMFLYIPPGKRYIHICPVCGARSVLIPPQISF